MSSENEEEREKVRLGEEDIVIKRRSERQAGRRELRASLCLCWGRDEGVRFLKGKIERERGKGT